MKTKPDDLCPCGSGRKYKKCCLPTHEEMSDEKHEEEYDDDDDFDEDEDDDEDYEYFYDDGYDEDDDFEDEFYNEYYKKFENADFDGKVSMIRDAFEDPELLDEELFFEVFNDLNDVLSSTKERKIYFELVQELKDREPEIYEDIEGYVLFNCVSNALIDSQTENAANLFKELAMIADEEIDLFMLRIDQVAYYGLLPLLVESMRIGWEQVEDSPDIGHWGIDEYTCIASDYELFDYLSETSEPSPADKTLVKKIKNYYEPDPEDFADYFACVTRKTGRKWSMDDFVKPVAKKGKKSKKAKELEPWLVKNISCLTNEFLDYLNKDEGISYPKADMMRTEMFHYLYQRTEGELERNSGLFDDMEKRQVKLPPEFENILCPDPDTFDRYLATMMNIMSSRFYRSMACFESVPAWLRFLESNSLIDFDLRKRTFVSIEKLYPDMEKIFSKIKNRDDFALSELKKAWDDPKVKG
ncbi:MAG: SEC-C domain-containing protein [Desulfobacteraceae bacterium]|nr:SEC-C domain-containing protein [Desulfobacteraceae bacterium]